MLDGIQGTFLLSSYFNQALTGFIEKRGWDTVEIRMSMPMLSTSGCKRQKTEVLTANYPITDKAEKVKPE
jgi:hypothetical protein